MFSKPRYCEIHTNWNRIKQGLPVFAFSVYNRPMFKGGLHSRPAISTSEGNRRDANGAFHSGKYILSISFVFLLHFWHFHDAYY